MGIAADGQGAVYVADYGWGTIRKLTFDSDARGWAAATIAGAVDFGGGCPGHQDGAGTQAQFCNPTGLAVDAAGRLFVADQGNNLIRMITLDKGTSVWTTATIAGDALRACGHIDGDGLAVASFCSPAGLAVSPAGEVFVTEGSLGGTVRKLTQDPGKATWKVETVAGTPGRIGVSTGALPGALNAPSGIAFSPAGDLYVADGEESSLLLLRQK
jgi:DNA-binding beta-propeller fold protein YncE